MSFILVNRFVQMSHMSFFSFFFFFFLFVINSEITQYRREFIMNETKLIWSHEKIFIFIFFHYEIIY